MLAEDKQPIPWTKFVPISIRDPTYLCLRNIKRCLSQNYRPLVVFLTHNPLDFPTNSDMPIIPYVIKIPKKRIPEGPEYYEFKRVVFDHLKQGNNTLIGVASTGKEISLYMICRWIMDEKNVSLSDVLTKINSIDPPGLKKSKYIESLNQLYNSSFDDSFFSDEKAIIKEPITLRSTQSLQAPIKVAPKKNKEDELEKIEVPSKDVIITAPEVVEDDQEGIYITVGQYVERTLEESTVNEIKECLNKKNCGLIRPYPYLNRLTLETIRSQDRIPYAIIAEPEGKRCLLYIRAECSYLVGSNGFIRLVRIFLPDSTNSNQRLTHCIFEGVLSYIRNEMRFIFFIGDILFYEGSLLRYESFLDRMAIVDRTVNDRNNCVKMKVNDQFMNDSFDVSIRKFFRIKYISYAMSSSIELKTNGILFVPKRSNINREEKYFYPFKEHLVIRVRINIDEKNNICYGSIKDYKYENQNVVVFSHLTEYLKNCNDQIVELLYYREEKQWRIRCLSSVDTESLIDEYQQLIMFSKSSPLTPEKLKDEIEVLRQLPCYVAEEKERLSRQ